ncbi:hypothetical protein Godav_004330 [Gossypium davidsonii]|uniref:Uncharacterized protein n=1 Tax=Gossypium davidsonii TaxID=34287 RepID=A0A7J8SLK4_GOSDV|nr:hypothetical protein [Gossypium davidsonii]
MIDVYDYACTMHMKRVRKGNEMVLDKFEGCQISMNWLKDNFNELPKDPKDRIGEVIQYARAYIMRGNHKSSYVGLLEVLEDIKLLLDQISKVKTDVGREGNVDSGFDSGNAQNRSGVKVVRVEAINFAATARPKGAAQGGHAGEGQHRLVGATRGVHQAMGSYDDDIHTRL